MSKENNGKTKLRDIENGDKLEELLKLMPFILELEKNKDRLLDNKPTTGSNTTADLDE